MTELIPCGRLPFALYFRINTRRKHKIRIVASDAYKPNSRYTDRTFDINGGQDMVLQFPVSPETMKFTVYNVERGNLADDRSFYLENIHIGKVQRAPMVFDRDTKHFIPFALQFAEDAGVIAQDLYINPKHPKFKILYQSEILRADGSVSTTPASVGHESKRIRVAQPQFIGFTIPARFGILLHEKGHVFDNPKIGREVDDEVAADIAALTVYLSMGFPRYDIKYVFAKIFYRADTPLNRKRLAIIDDFIAKFDNGQIIKNFKFKYDT